MQKSIQPVFKVSSATSNRIIWNKDYEAQLRILVQQYQGRNWKKIAEEMQKIFKCPELTAKKCRERWCNCANPELDKTALTEVEELFLLFYHYEYKNKWTLISQRLPNRNSTKLKNNFSSFIRKVCRKIVLNDRVCVNSMLSYLQILYATSLIHEMITSSANCDKEELLAPTHIYEHIRKKKITGEQCMEYIKTTTESLVGKYRVLEKLKEMKKMSDVQSFLYKLMPIIKGNHSPNDSLTEASLIEAIELSLRENSPIAKIKEEVVKEVEVEKEIGQSKELPNIPIIKDIGYVAYQHSTNLYENDPLRTPEIQGITLPALQSPLQLSNDIGIHIPTFASPAFQASLQSTQSNYGNPLFSPNYIPSFQLLKSPEQVYMLQLPPPASDLSLHQRVSDFTAFTNKYF